MRTKYFKEYMNTYCVLRTYARSTNYKPWSHHTTFCTPSILTNGSALCGEQYWLLFCPYVAVRPVVCWSVIYPYFPSFLPKLIQPSAIFDACNFKNTKSIYKKFKSLQYHNSSQSTLWTVHETSSNFENWLIFCAKWSDVERLPRLIKNGWGRMILTIVSQYTSYRIKVRLLFYDCTIFAW